MNEHKQFWNKKKMKRNLQAPCTAYIGNVLAITYLACLHYYSSCFFSISPVNCSVKDIHRPVRLKSSNPWNEVCWEKREYEAGTHVEYLARHLSYPLFFVCKQPTCLLIIAANFDHRKEYNAKRKMAKEEKGADQERGWK